MEKSQLLFRVRENSPAGWQHFLVPPLNTLDLTVTTHPEDNDWIWGSWRWRDGVRDHGPCTCPRAVSSYKITLHPPQERLCPENLRSTAAVINGDNLNPMLSEKACVQGSKIHNCFIQLQGRHSPGLKTVSHIYGRHQLKYPNHSCFCYKNCHSINLCERSEKHHLVRYHGSISMLKMQIFHYSFFQTII